MYFPISFSFSSALKQSVSYIISLEIWGLVCNQSEMELFVIVVPFETFIRASPAMNNLSYHLVGLSGSNSCALCG